MKRMIRVLIAAAILVTSLTCTAFAATKDYTEDKSTNATSYVGEVNYVTEGTDVPYYTATYTGDDLIATNQYVLLVATVGADGTRQITEEGIQYIDQAEVTNGSITFKFIPKNVEVSEVLLGGVFNGGESPKVLGALKVPYKLGDVDLDGSVMPNDAYTTLQMYVGLLTDYTNTQFMAADVDFDSQIMPNDAYKILQYYVGLITEF